MVKYINVIYLYIVTGPQPQHMIHTENTECLYEPYEHVLVPKVKDLKEPPPEVFTEKDFGRVSCHFL